MEAEELASKTPCQCCDEEEEGNVGWTIVKRKGTSKEWRKKVQVNTVGKDEGRRKETMSNQRNIRY